MPEQPELESRPRCYLAEGQTWPDGRLTDSAPPEAVLAQQIARTFKRACEELGHTHRQAAKEIGISATNVQSLLSGDGWSSLRTLASIENSYSIKLWVSQQGSLRPHPRSWLVKNLDPCPEKDHDPWLDGPLETGTPPEAKLAQQLSRRLREACGARFYDPDDPRGFDAGKVATETKLPQPTIEDLLDGRIWCDLPMIARIEGTLGISLWVSQQNQKDAYG